jgi:hypothetical protein
VISGAACDITSILAHYPSEVKKLGSRRRRQGASRVTAELQSTGMSPSKTLASKPRWYLIPVRVLLVTFLLTLLSFALSLLLGILGLAIAAGWRGLNPNMAAAYRHIALPSAAVVGVIVLISASVIEIRHYRQAKALAEIERMS